MSTGVVAGGMLSADEQRLLSAQWRSLRRVATGVAVLSSPAVFVYLHKQQGWQIGWSLVASVIAVAAFRGALDLLFHRFIRWPSLFGIDTPELREEDVVARRRVWFWHFWAKVVYLIALVILTVYVVRLLRYGFDGTSFFGTFGDVGHWLAHTARRMPSYAAFGLIFVVYFIFNFGILLGPMLLMGVSQIRGYEPGDADWGVKLDDVRGQAEAKEEVRRVVNLWQSGEAFELAGGRRERGLLFLGAPGTGKTMLAKAIATGFNSPIVTIPGSGFAQTFIGMDAIIVRFLARKAKRLARKWGGRLFAERAPAAAPPDRPWLARILNQGGVFPGMFGGGGQLALNQLLIVMDGIDNPPFVQRMLTNVSNKVLDALYFVPRRLGRVPLRLPHTHPGRGQIYFIGATNVPMEMLDPALTRPGRLGRHVWFRTPTKQDRLDIFDLYLGKVAHEPDLDTEKRRDELARVTNGYSPAMVEQVCSMALTLAHHDGRLAFGWEDIVEAMTTVESGTAIGTEYVPEETRAVAIHEAGHAAAAHVFLKGA